MTIHGISSFLKKRAPTARQRVPVRFFRGKRVAIDGTLKGCAMMSLALSSEAQRVAFTPGGVIDEKKVTMAWLRRFVRLLVVFREARLRPYFVFDGPGVPVEKAAQREIRAEARAKLRAEIAELRATIAKEDLVSDDVSRARLASLLQRDISISPGQWQQLHTFLRALGVTVIQAPGEGEAFCATLYHAGLCDVVYTEDSDTTACNLPHVMVGLDMPAFDHTGRRIQQCEVIYYERVCRALQLSRDALLDLCIMCGTDYNRNVRGFGPVKCYQLLLKHGRLADIPEDVYDRTTLNYARVREIFTTPCPLPADFSTEEEPFDAEEARRTLQKYNLLDVGSRLVELTLCQGDDSVGLAVESFAGDEDDALQVDTEELL